MSIYEGRDISGGRSRDVIPDFTQVVFRLRYGTHKPFDLRIDLGRLQPVLRYFQLVAFNNVDSPDGDSAGTPDTV